MSSLPKPHINVPVQSGVNGLAPLFAEAVAKTVADMRLLGHKPLVYETLRTPERQRFLYGFGRTYDDGRGIVTHSETSLLTWHGYGLAADIVEDDATPWTAKPKFWSDLGVCAEQNGLTWGGRWKFLDLPHVQWGKCLRTPTKNAQFIMKNGGTEAVWDIVKAR